MTLTVEQIARIREVADQWVRAGLSTQRCDRSRAEDSVRFAYRSAGLDEPRHVVWMDSPVGGMFAAAMIKSTATATPLPNHVWSLIGEQPWDVIRDQLGSQLAQHLWTQIVDQLADPLGGRPPETSKPGCGASSRIGMETGSASSWSISKIR
jgi:hypothetical protein